MNIKSLRNRKEKKSNFPLFYHAQTDKNTIFKYVRNEKKEILFTWEESNFRSFHAWKKKKERKKVRNANFQQIKITNNAITWPVCEYQNRLFNTVWRVANHRENTRKTLNETFPVQSLPGAKFPEIVEWHTFSP